MHRNWLFFGLLFLASVALAICTQDKVAVAQGSVDSGVRSQHRNHDAPFVSGKVEPFKSRKSSNTNSGVIIASGTQTYPIFKYPPTYPAGEAGVSDLKLADVNADGKLDLITTDGTGSVDVLLGNGDGSFQSPVRYNTGGTSAGALFVADVNGDGKQDLIVADSYGIGVFLGNGDGTFGPVGNYPGGGSALSNFTVADVNRDGKPDIVVANLYGPGYGNATVDVLLGNGDGTFQSAYGYLTGGVQAESVAVADVNGDGKVDLVVGNRCMSPSCSGSTVGILLGNGDGTFQSAQILESGFASYSVVLADVNHDGRVDLLVGGDCGPTGDCNGENGVIEVFLNYGSSFADPVAYQSGAFGTEFVQVADVNGDGNPDLVVANRCEGSGWGGTCVTGSISVLLGKGDGSFGVPLTYANGMGVVAVEDVNGDGKPDIVVSDYCGGYPTCPIGSVAVLFGNGDGTFQGVPNYPANGAITDATATADVNGDGKLDLIIGNECLDSTCTQGGVSVLLGNGDGTFRSGHSYGSGGTTASSVTVADLNGDGKPDLVIGNTNCFSSGCSGASLGVMLGNGDGTFHSAVNYSAANGWGGSVAVGDLNGDGKLDLVLANECSDTNCDGSVAVFLGNGDGSFQPALSLLSGGERALWVTIADVNGDGRPDLVVAHPCLNSSTCSNGVIGVLLGNGDGTFQAPITYDSGALDSLFVATMDINGDGKPDLVVANQEQSSTFENNSAITVLLGNGDGTFQSPIVTPTTSLINGALAIADFDGDGKLDVASGAGAFLLIGNGDGTFQSNYSLGVGDQAVVAGDFNGDGKPDLAIGTAILMNITGLAKSASSTALTSSLPLAAYGQAVTFTATVTPEGAGFATGAVTFTDGSKTLGTAYVIDGAAMLKTSALAASAHNIVASYSGDSNFLASTSSPLAQNVNQATTATTLSSSANPGYLNQTITFTAKVISQYGGTLTGSVTFKQGTTSLATVALASGQASFSTSYSTTGTRSIAAVYSGDSNNIGSTSTGLSQAVNALPAATTIKVATSGSPSFINQPITFSATTSSTYGPIPNGETVTFYDGTTLLGTGSIASGVATLTTSTLAVRTHTIKAMYPGDTTFKASSGTVTQIVSLYPSSTSLPISTLNPSIYGQSVTLTTRVSSTAPSSPTGKLTFKNGSISIGSATINSAGVGTLTLRSLPAGSLSITASYGGDSETAKSVSPTLSQTVSQASSTTTVKSSLNPATAGQSVTFTAKVTSPTTTATGTVTFMDGNTVLGTGTLSSGQTSYATSALNAGPHSIVAIYAGTINVKGSTSSILVQVVN